MKTRPLDIAVCAAVILSAVFLLVLPKIFSAEESSGVLLVSVRVNGEELARFPLSEDREFDCGNGVTVSVSGGKAFISESDCPDKTCMRAGKLDASGETAVCLPNRTVVKIVGAPETEVDGIV
ncbi:MAG: NusG domain II-containing protein [Clostridiales bacterium]|nr:NusG domain II-containing protein [Clostridiales bacterium]